MAVTLGIDIGTTSTVGILIETDGRVLASATRPVDLRSPRPGWAEEDPEQWWANCCAIVPELLRTSRIAAADIVAIGITGMLPAVVLLDLADRIIRPSIQQSDGRTVAEVSALRHELDEAAFTRRTGNGVNQQLVAAKLRWIARHEPRNFTRIATCFGSYDFINFRLTGARRVEQNWALEAGFVDLATDALADDLIALAGIERGRVPPLARSFEIIGVVTPEAAVATGLATGTPVVAGCADHVASAFVAGIVEPGDVLLKFGGAGDILLAADVPKPDPRLFLDYHIVPGRFMPNGCMASSGSLLNWVARELASGRPHAALDRLAADVLPGADGLLMLPYFLGEKTPIHDAGARGALIGLGLHHRVEHIWRAALEAVVMAFRHHVEVFGEIGYPVDRLFASDGGAKSRLWMQIAADGLAMPVHLLDGHPGSCLGAAYVAAMGVQAADDWDGISRFVSLGETIEPQRVSEARYRAVYGAYRDLYPALKPLYPRLCL